MDTQPQVPKETIRRIAKETAESTIQDHFNKLGIDYSNIRQSQQDFAALRDMRETFTSRDYMDDMAHLRRWRLLVGSILSQVVFVVVGLIVVGICAFIWTGFKDSVATPVPVTAPAVIQQVAPAVSRAAPNSAACPPGMTPEECRYER